MTGDSGPGSATIFFSNQGNFVNSGSITMNGGTDSFSGEIELGSSGTGVNSGTIIINGGGDVGVEGSGFDIVTTVPLAMVTVESL